ncbi:MAG: signal peptidase II [Raoultibacter sp.]
MTHDKQPATQHKDTRTKRQRNALVFAVVALIWLTLDGVTKAFFESTQTLGQVMPASEWGLIHFRLVHNTGAAWGMFGNATWLLGALSLLVCAALLVYLFVLAPRSSTPEVIGLALVFAGGLGNALDRFLRGYVVDFIETTFMDFPVFNVADIGVTCGFVIFIVFLLIHEKKRAAQGSEEHSI